MFLSRLVPCATSGIAHYSLSIVSRLETRLVSQKPTKLSGAMAIGSPSLLVCF